MREHGQNTDNLRTVGEQVILDISQAIETAGSFGGPPETRTPDPLIKSQLLYQLS